MQPEFAPVEENEPIDIVGDDPKTLAVTQSTL
jgi:hypothetical protein